MDGKVEVSLPELELNQLLRLFSVADDTLQPTHWHVTMDQELCLIPFESGRIIRVAAEVSGLEQGPIDLIQIGRI